MPSHIEDLAEIDNLRQALRFVRQDQEDQSLKDPLKDIPFREKRTVDSRLSDLRTRLISGDYEPRRPIIIESPKGNYTTRPMAQISLADWIVAQAIANTIAEKLDSKIPADASFAYRLNPDRYEKTSSKFFKSWKYEWPEFRDRVRRNITPQLPCIVVTDIAGYYEHIDLQLLGKMLLDAKIPLEIVDLIFSQLQKWTWQHQFSTNPSRGLLQGNDISSLYANFYLYQLDEYFRDQGLTYHRYVDDIAIHVPELVTAKRALGDLARFLRKFGLTLNSRKTRILSGPDIENHFNFAVGDELEAHLDSLKHSGETPVLKAERRRLRKTVLPLNNPTLTKRLLTTYTRARDPAFRSKAVALLETQPDWTINLCRYFRSLDDNRSVNDILAFLRDPTRNIYASQEQQLVECLQVMSVRSDPIRRSLKDLGWSLLRSNSAHPYSRALATLLVYRCGDTIDAEKLVDRYLDPSRPESHPLPRKHLALAVTRLVDREAKTQRVISTLKGEPDPDLTETGLFIEQIRQTSASRTGDVLAMLGLVQDQYDRPHKGKAFRLDTRDLILLNLCRASPQGRQQVRSKAQTWKKLVVCPLAQTLLEEVIRRT